MKCFKLLGQWHLPQLVRFAYGLQNDITAVAAAADTRWSTGPVEGQINRLKMVKRQMYGRAGLELLRARVSPYFTASSRAGTVRCTKIAEEPNSG